MTVDRPTRRTAPPGAPQQPAGRRAPHRGRRRVLAAVAAVAAATGGAALLLGPGGQPTSLVASAPRGLATPEASEPVSGTPLPAVWPRPTAEALEALAAGDATFADPGATARAYLLDRLGPGPEVGLEVAGFRAGDAGTGAVAFTTTSGATGEVVVHRLGGDGGPWYVVAARTDLLVLEPVLEDGGVVLRVGTEVAGTLTHDVSAPDGELLLAGSTPVDEPRTVRVGRLDREGPVIARIRLDSAEGSLLAHLEVRAEPNPVGPGDVADPGFPGVWPVADEAALAARRADVAAGRAEATGPEDTAVAFLTEELDLAVAESHDAESTGPLTAQVGYRTEDGAAGVVALGRLTEAEDDVWFVTEVTSEVLRVVAVRHEGDTLVVEVEAAVAGELTGVARRPGGPEADLAPRRLERPSTTSIDVAGVPHHGVVVLRLAAADGSTSVAVLKV